MDRSRRTRLYVGAAVVGASAAAAYSVYIWLSYYVSDPFHNDFTFYYSAAKLGLDHGWSNLYDLGLQQQELAAIGSQIHVAELARYVSPPPLAWLVAPFTVLPFHGAYWAWSGLLLAALWLTCRLAAPGQGRTYLIFFVAGIGWLPLVYGLYLSQPVLLVTAGVGASCVLLSRDRQVLAGVLLGALVFKPQVAWLAPAALLVMGRWRALAATVVTFAVLAAVSAVALGPQGVNTYFQVLSFASTVPESRAQTLAAWIPSVGAAHAVQVLIAAWTLAIGYRLRSRGPAAVFAIILVGGSLASPYSHWDDQAVLGLACLLLLREPRQRVAPFAAAALAIAGEGFPVWGAGPALAVEFAVLVLFSVLAFRRPSAVPTAATGELSGAGLRLP